MNELAGFQTAHLRHHLGQQGVGGDVERHPQKRVGAALVQLARKPPFGHIELKQHVTRRKGHRVDLRDIPRRNDDAPRLGVGADHFDGLRDLVDGAPVGAGPRTPLVAVDVVQVAEAVALDRRLDARSREESLPVDGQHSVAHAQFVVITVSVVVPDMDPVFDEVFDIGVPAQEPQQFVDHPFQKDLLGRQQGEPLRQVETHLMAEDPFGPGSRAVAPHDAFRLDPAQQIEVLFHDSRVISPAASSTAQAGFFSQQPRFTTCRRPSR